MRVKFLLIELRCLKRTFFSLHHSVFKVKRKQAVLAVAAATASLFIFWEPFFSTLLRVPCIYVTAIHIACIMQSVAEPWMRPSHLLF